MPSESSSGKLTKDLDEHNDTIELKNDLSNTYYRPETNDETVNQVIGVENAAYSDISHETDYQATSTENEMINARFFCNTRDIKGLTSPNELSIHVAKQQDQIIVKIRGLRNSKKVEISEYRKYDCPYCSKAFPKR